MTEINYLQCSAIYTELARTTPSYWGNQALRTAQRCWQWRGCSSSPLLWAIPLAANGPRRNCWLASHPRGRITCKDHQGGSGPPRAVHIGFAVWAPRGWAEPISGPPAFEVDIPPGGTLSLLIAKVSPVPLVLACTSGQRVFCSGTYLLEADLGLSMSYGPLLVFTSK